MKEINCNIIQDILPLYVDDVVSEDTREMVEEHLKSCDTCRKEADILKQNVNLPTSRNIKLSDARILRKLKQRFFKRKVIISVVSVAVAAAAVLGLHAYMVLTEIFVPYDSGKVSIEEIDGKIYASYEGDTLGGTKAINPTQVMIKGEKKKAAFLCYYETPWSRYVQPIVSGGSGQDGNKDMFCLGDKTEIDRVYYAEFDFDHEWRRPDISMEEFLEPIIDRGEMVWEK